MHASHAVAAATGPNCALLRQTIELVASLGAERYTRRVPVAFNASIGAHVRHVVDHYRSLLAGLGGDRPVDYESRARDPALEQDPAQACAALAEIERVLAGLGRSPPPHPLAYATETWPRGQAPTSLVRELEFLLSHTVHHCALVAVMCRLQGHATAPGFGVAPSTLRHEHASLACAP